MSSYTWYASEFAILDSEAPNLNDHTSASAAVPGITPTKTLLAGFTVPALLKGKTITSWRYYAYATALYDRIGTGCLYPLVMTKKFNSLTATYENFKSYFPSYASDYSQNVIAAAGYQELNVWNGKSTSDLYNVKNYGLCMRLQYIAVNTPANNGVKIELTYSDATLNAYVSAKTIDPSVANTLTWGVTGGTFGAPEQTSAVLTYKKAGDDTEYTVNISGSSYSYTVAANTFPVGTSQYMVSCTLADGRTVSSNWANITVPAIYADGVTPASGYVRNEDAVIFAWDIRRSASIGAVITGGTLEWKNGSSGTVTSINTGTAKTYTMPANALPNSAGIMWRLSGVTTAAGDNYSSGWYTVTTLESLSSAAITEPNAVTVDGSAEIILRWSHIIDTGTAPTGFKIQTSTNGSTWTDLVTNTSSNATSCTVAANTFTSGTRYWRVQTYNSDGTAGSWSAAASFVVVASPSTPAIAVLDASPRPQIRWTTTEQEGCEVTMDGVKYTVYGSEQTWRSPVYLEDGAHSVSVRVINQYGLWSEPGTAVIPVSNTAGGNIYLTAATGSTAALSWESDGYDFFVVYRDGVAIAKTAASEYADLFSCDDVIYRVRGCYADSYNYGLSDAVPVCVLPEALTIIDGATGAKLELKYFDAERGSSQWSRSRQAASSHYAGQKRPSVEISEFEDEVLTVGNIAIVSRTVKKALCGMIGRLVCLKTPDGDMAVGALLSLTRTSTKYFGVYSISVTNSAYEEAVLL